MKRRIATISSSLPNISVISLVVMCKYLTNATQQQQQTNDTNFTQPPSLACHSTWKLSHWIEAMANSYWMSWATRGGARANAIYDWTRRAWLIKFRRLFPSCEVGREDSKKYLLVSVAYSEVYSEVTSHGKNDLNCCFKVMTSFLVLFFFFPSAVSPKSFHVFLVARLT